MVAVGGTALHRRGAVRLAGWASRKAALRAAPIGAFQCELRAAGDMKTTSRRILRRRVLALTAIAGAIVFFGYDLVTDALFEGEFGSPHFIVELIVFLGVSMALVVGARDLRRLRVRLEREARRNRALAGALADNISEQMDEWRMTRSEKDVAWLIIKGYRFSEIAQARGVKESTTRLQATSLYAKAGVSGRAEFVAEMIQPLLLSVPDNPSRHDGKPSDRIEPR